ncbi:MAG: NfeD family protein [Terrisporobacter othiniensis]|uniref:NfeD family protein n=2 Tax=Terrisporobacter hibernicus TaxID=2813371 RepID=A0AAX2ZNS8_9FIRM|nr:NfeD family protein [Terrisporobacter petrolearius]MDU4861435.1 NfeD family protein [Terrisporobacter othiniensis]MDU6994616.1 NfeD family protein [Terrisporobacter othiniensis]UEL49789.1 NfeD family protein [Terrisporobacter hibernicus]
MNTVWLIVAVAFGIAELMTTSLTLVWFSIGALVLMVLSTFIESVIIQIALFAAISITLLVTFTKYFVDKDKTFKYNTNLQGIEQKTGVVKVEILPYATGIVTLTGEDWTAISDSNEKIEVEQLVKVIRIEGVKLVVKPIDNQEEK